MHLLLHWPMSLKFQIRFCQEPKTKPAKNPGRVKSRKMLAERNGLACEAKKNQKPPEAPSDEENKEPENPSRGVNGFLLLDVEDLAVSALGVYYQ